MTNPKGQRARQVLLTSALAASAMVVGVSRTSGADTTADPTPAGQEASPTTGDAPGRAVLVSTPDPRPDAAQVAATAARHAIDPAELAADVDRGAALIDADGMLQYVDRFEHAHAEPTEASGALAIAHNPARPASRPHEATFTLHSRPGARKVAYLDFDGAHVADTGWNETYTGGAAFDVTAYDIDDDPAAFSTGELDAVQEIWERVSEDFAPFDIDVTTEAPAPEAILRSSVADQEFGISIVITNTSLIYAACGCGGFTYTGSFNYVNDENPERSHAYYAPGFVFQQGVGPSPKTIAEATAHELGHALGLVHDESNEGAFSGHGDWAPIMGTAYGKPITQWSRGEYAGAIAESQTDDFLTIQQHGGALVGDDVGDTVATALVLDPSGRHEAVISTALDRDVYSFTTAGSSVAVVATPSAVSPNLDISIELLDAAGAVVATANPASEMVSIDHADGLGAMLRATLPAGTYYVRIDGVGDGDASTAGYSDYASVGRYRLDVVEARGANVPPIAQFAASSASGRGPLSVTFSSTGSGDPDGSIATLLWDFGDGSTLTEPHPTHTFVTPGEYTVTLTVTDDQGAVATSAMTVSVVDAANRVDSLELTMLPASDLHNVATSDLVLAAADGTPLARALVVGAWSGSDRRWVMGITDDAGRVSFRSNTTGKAGSNFGFTVIWAGHLGGPDQWNRAAMTSAYVWAGGPQYWAAASPV